VQKAAGSCIKGGKVKVLGATFKKDFGHLRNRKFIDIVKELRSYIVNIKVAVPTAEPSAAMHQTRVMLELLYNLPRGYARVASIVQLEYEHRSIKGLGKKLVNDGALMGAKVAFASVAMNARELGPLRL